MPDDIFCPTVATVKNKKKRMDVFLFLLKERYGEILIALNHSSPFELICATVLSAQCTDRQVNIVTPHLFAAYPTAEELGRAKVEDVEKIVKSTGFYKNKAKNLVALGKALTELGGVPQELEELVKLPGVGRKTANVVLGNSFGIPGMVVDTHVGRITYRWKFTDNTDPVKVEFDLMKQMPESEWTDFSHRVIYLGREFCTARKPKCDICPFNKSL